MWDLDAIFFNHLRDRKEDSVGKVQFLIKIK